MPRRLSFTRLNFVQQPLLFVAVSFISGMLLAAGGRIPARDWLVAGACSWVAAAIALWLRMTGIAVVALSICGCLAAGGALWSINEEGEEGKEVGKGESAVSRLFERGDLRSDEPVEIWGLLNTAPELAPDRIYLSIEVEKAATLGRELKASGVISVVAPFTDYESRLEYDALALDYGTRVRLLARLSNRGGYRNPGAPDFARLLEDRGIEASGWVKSPLLIERLGEGKRQPILARLYSIRARALAVILRRLRQPAAGILAAALFGNQHFLGHDTAEVFRAGGTFHLLVISGLHLALIGLAAVWLSGFLINSRAVRSALVLVLIWAYCLMVGAQPAVTRSAVMLSLVFAGQTIFRESGGANSLAASAIALLCYQPRDLFNPGFQLSFLTVLIIVVLTGPLTMRLKQTGQWQPTRLTPYPPRLPRLPKTLAEILFWNEAGFREEMSKARIRYRLGKSRVARWINVMRVQKALAWVALTLFTTTSVQIGLLPLMVAQFHRVSLMSPALNVIEAALIFALMIAGVLYLLIHALAAGIANRLAGAVNLLGELSVKASRPFLSFEWANLRVPDLQPVAPVTAVFFAAVLILVVIIDGWNPLGKGERKRRGRVGAVLAFASTFTIVVLCCLLVLHPFEHQYDRGRLSVTFLDVGQGDAILIAFPAGSLMMLDAGGRPDYGAGEAEDLFVEDRVGIAEAAVMPYLWQRGIKKLDWIVASHGDADHVEGFSEIIRCFKIGAALGETKRFEVAGLPVRTARRGDRLEIDGTQLEVLSPPAEAGDSPLSDNNRSLVVKLTYGDRSFLLTGDSEREAEAFLVKSGSDLGADVLKVAHHGSRTSTTAEFLKQVSPRHAVISVADPSPYGHPNAEVIERLRASGARIWQTSACGAITASTDGHDLRVESFVRCE